MAFDAKKHLLRSNGRTPYWDIHLNYKHQYMTPLTDPLVRGPAVKSHLFDPVDYI